MLKTIKTTKQMNLQELIKHVWENGITDVTYTTQDGGARITFDADGDVETEFCIEKCDYFDVEIEEPITDVTLLEKAVYVHKNETLVKDFNTSIDEILIGKHEGSVSEIYALINGKLELIWENDEDE